MDSLFDHEQDIGSNVFVVELLKALNKTLQEQNKLLRELLELTRDMRDIAATQKEHPR